MATEEQRAEFTQKWQASHVQYQEERDKQYDIYKFTCKRNQGERDRELARMGPLDRAGIALAHERYDSETRRADHLYDRYETRAWKKHQAEAAELRSQYDIGEVSG